MISPRFFRFSAGCAVLAGVAALGYSITFTVVVESGARWASWASTALLGAGALAGLPVLVALYLRVRPAEEGLALVALLVGATAAAGTALHAAFDLAVLANPTTQGSELPNFTDPRGFATFLLAGATMALLAALLHEAGAPRALVGLGALNGLLLAWIWIGRLTVLDPKHLAFAPAVALAGFVTVPLWYVAAGRWLVPRGNDLTVGPVTTRPTAAAVS